MEKTPRQQEYSGLRVVLFGPESTGKSTLAKQLAAHFDTLQVEEYAREYLQKKMDLTGLICSYEDLVPICEGQIALENKALPFAGKFLFCDTDAVETWTYSHIYFNTVPDQIEQIISSSHYDLYLLMDIDLPWVQDDLRDRPNNRPEIFEQFQAALVQWNKNYVKISGTGSLRFENALKAINNYPFNGDH
jgi:HTH-type transcriptional repressor of NAD biosynthesis genes